jgi:hypothetical protein
MMPAHSCNMSTSDVLLGANTLAGEAATPHAHPSPLMGRNLVTVRITVLKIRDLTLCVSPLQIVTSRRA